VVALRFVKTGGWRGNWPYLPKVAGNCFHGNQLTPVAVEPGDYINYFAADVLTFNAFVYLRVLRGQ